MDVQRPKRLLTNLMIRARPFFYRNNDALSEAHPGNEETTNQLASTTTPLSDGPAGVAGTIIGGGQGDLERECEAAEQIGAGEIGCENQSLTEPEAAMEGNVEPTTSWQTAMGAFWDEGKDLNPPAGDVVFKTLQHGSAQYFMHAAPDTGTTVVFVDVLKDRLFPEGWQGTLTVRCEHVEGDLSPNLNKETGEVFFEVGPGAYHVRGIAKRVPPVSGRACTIGSLPQRSAISSAPRGSCHPAFSGLRSGGGAC